MDRELRSASEPDLSRPLAANASNMRGWLKTLAGMAALGLRTSVCGAAWMPGTSTGMTALDLGPGDPRHD